MASALLWLASCSCTPNANNTTTCSYTFQNGPTTPPSCTPVTGTVTGLILFGDGIPLTQGAHIVVQWSTDNFASTTFLGVNLVNLQGMPVVPYGFNVNICGTLALQVRAFQDSTNSGSWVATEPAGRYDGTSTGNGTLTTVNLSTSATSVSDIDVTLDGTSGQ